MGKSCFINFFAGEEIAKESSKKLSCTKNYRLYNIVNEKYANFHKKINFLDTVGLLDTGNTKDKEIYQ
jgi:hypothetical protein